MTLIIVIFCLFCICLQSYKQEYQAKQEHQDKQEIQQNNSMKEKKKLKREDFMFQNGWFETKIKRPQQLQMQQFQISDCQQCNILLYDSNACIYIDSCKYCNIFVGPCESSIFVRDCEGLTLISISQQFRVRDSLNCKFAIYCQSQPIIQSSKDLTFSCYPSEFIYKQLQKQMRQTKMNEWNNNWFDIYDFTPKKFNQPINYSLSAYEKQFVLLKEIFLFNLKQQQILETKEKFIPSIQGKIQMQTNDSYRLDDVVFMAIYPLITAKSVQSLILQSKYILLKDQVNQLFSNNIPAKQKVLFLKIKKEDQSRWKKCQNVLKVFKIPFQKDLIQGVIFAPFKDQH